MLIQCGAHLLLPLNVGDTCSELLQLLQNGCHIALDVGKIPGVAGHGFFVFCGLAGIFFS